MRFEALVNGALAVAAFALVGVIGLREVRVRRAPDPSEPVYVAGWESAMTVAKVRGVPGIRVLAFMDLECPFCRTFHETVDSIFVADSTDLSISFVSFPLRMHRLALPAAWAAECAHRQGKFFAFANEVLRGQDLLGIRSWGEYAHDAGVNDTTELNRCMKRPDVAREVERGIEVGARLGVKGTPTVLVEGLRMTGTPTASDFTEAITAARYARAGRTQ